MWCAFMNSHRRSHVQFRCIRFMHTKPFRVSKCQTSYCPVNEGSIMWCSHFSGCPTSLAITTDWIFVSKASDLELHWIIASDTSLCTLLAGYCPQFNGLRTFFLAMVEVPHCNTSLNARWVHIDSQNVYRKCLTFSSRVCFATKKSLNPHKFR